jgi:hypothetical protein
MDAATIQYLGYALQLILVLVLVVSLACKSWALLGVCLGASMVLLVLVCIEVVHKKNTNTTSAQNRLSHPPRWENVQLMKRDTMAHNTYPSQVYDMHMYPNQGMVTYDTNMYPNQGMASYAMYAPLPQHTHPAYQSAEYVPIDERVALDIMSHVDRGASMQAPVRKYQRRGFVATSQGEDMTPQPDMYRVAVAGQKSQKLPPHMDPFSPQNPMNSLSYLHTR